MPVVLFGCGSPMIVDFEESCGRLGLEIAAIVKNFDCADFGLARERIVKADDVAAEIKRCPYAVPFFTPGHRFAADKDARARGFQNAATIVDPTAIVASSANFGPGTYVNSGVIVGGAVRIGAFVFVNRGASIGHHVELGDFSSIGPGAILCGGVRLGRGAVAGAGSVILENLEIGRNAVIAAGAVVRDRVEDHCLVAGNPARVIEADHAGYRNFSV